MGLLMQQPGRLMLLKFRTTIQVHVLMVYRYKRMTLFFSLWLGLFYFSYLGFVCFIVLPWFCRLWPPWLGLYFPGLPSDTLTHWNNYQSMQSDKDVGGSDCIFLNINSMINNVYLKYNMKFHSCWINTPAAECQSKLVNGLTKVMIRQGGWCFTVIMGCKQNKNNINNPEPILGHFTDQIILNICKTPMKSYFSPLSFNTYF